MTPQPAAPHPDAVLDVVRTVVAEFLGLTPDHLDDNKDLRAHGADSIDRVEILVTLKSRFGLDTPLAAFTGIPHLRGLAEYLREQTGLGR